MNRRRFMGGLLAAPFAAKALKEITWEEPAEAMPVLSKEEVKTLPPMAVEAPSHIPPGTVLPFVGDPPEGWLLCDGRAVGVKEYPALYDAIGQTYGVVDTSYRFKLPDLRASTAAVTTGNHNHGMTPEPPPNQNHSHTVNYARADHCHSVMTMFQPFQYMIKV